MMSHRATNAIRSVTGNTSVMGAMRIGFGLLGHDTTVFGGCSASTMALRENSKEQKDQKEETVGGGSGGGGGGPKGKEVASYWGVPPSRVMKEDGTEWKWNCFRPWETYQADMSIDLKKHHVPKTFLDKFAYWTVKSLRFPTDIFFQV